MQGILTTEGHCIVCGFCKWFSYPQLADTQYFLRCTWLALANRTEGNNKPEETWLAQLLHLPRRRLLPHRRQSVFYVRRMNSTRFVLTFYLFIFFIILREIVTASAVVVSTLAVITTAFTNKQVNRVLLLPIMFHKPPTIYWTKEIFIQIARVIGPPGASLSSKTIDNGMPLA